MVPEVDGAVDPDMPRDQHPHAATDATGSGRALVVVGAGGLGRETVAWARRAGFDVVGFLDEDSDRQGDVVGGTPIVGGLGWLDGPGVDQFGGEVGCVVAIGSTRARRAVTATLAAAGHATTTVIDPAVVLGERVDIGRGAILCPGATVSVDARIGADTVVSVGCSVHHDDVVGAHVFIGPGVQLSGNVTIGDGAWVGIGASVVQGVTIGAGTTVGAGAVVVDDLPANVTAVGVPARITSHHDEPW